MADFFKVIHGYKLTAYKRVPEHKRDLTRPYWSYERYRCIEDAFLIYLQEEYENIKSFPLSKAPLIKLLQQLIERIEPIAWHFPNLQPAYPEYQDIVDYVLKDPKHPFNKPPRTVLYNTDPPPVFYTMETFLQAFPDIKLYPPLTHPIQMRNYFNHPKKKKAEITEQPIIPVVHDYEHLKAILPLTPDECYIPPHPLWDRNDPPENTISFMVKFFGCRTYNDLYQHQPEFANGRLYANKHLKDGFE